MNVQPMAAIDLGQRIGQLRASPLQLGPAGKAIVLAFGADYDVDPFHEMFFFPTDTLKLAVITPDGRTLWTRDLGRGVVPGMWFCPVLPFDLDGDGIDELWFVNNVDPVHPLSLTSRRLERVDPQTGETTGQWPWPIVRGRGDQSPSAMFREFLIGGHLRNGEPVLVSAQGTYGLMSLQGWRPDMTSWWHVVIPAGSPGALGSHMCPVVDLNHDGDDELLWGERCISLADGRQLFCCDETTWRGHSDMIQPVLDRASGDWSIYTFRESLDAQGPRVAMFDARGQRIWSAIDQGHMDMGWVATVRVGDKPVCTTIRIRSKGSGPAGHVHRAMEEFAFDFDGRPIELPYRSYQTIPVDLNGDGVHEIVRGRYGGDGAILDGATGTPLATIGQEVSLACKFAGVPGEQLLGFDGPTGRVTLWRDVDAVDSPEALRRYANRFYAANARLGASGYHVHVLGGI